MMVARHMSDVLTSGVFWTAVVGLAGITAAFFAPAWSQRHLSRRGEARAFRQMKRLVVYELTRNREDLDRAAPDPRFRESPEELPGYNSAAWDEYRASLAEALEDDDWEALHEAYGFVSIIRALGLGAILSKGLQAKAREEGRSDEIPTREVDDSDYALWAKMFEETRRHAIAAVDLAIERLTAAEPMKD